MTFDAALALRMITNSRLRTAQSWGAYRDLGGALAVTSDAPIPELNCLGDFSVPEHGLDALLDVGFALLRAFDREPAVELTPLDRPATIAAHLAARGLRRTGGRSWMAFRGDVTSTRINPGVEVHVAEPDDAREFAALHGGRDRWARVLSLSGTLGAMLDPGNTFYLGRVEGQAVATLHLLRDGATAGIYAVGTARAHRKRGISTTLMARAITDAQAAGCDLIYLSTDLNGYAEGLYSKQGFEKMFESELWEASDRT